MTLLEDIDQSYKYFIYLYIHSRKVHICRIVEGCTRHPRIVAAFLDKTFQESREKLLSEKL